MLIKMEISRSPCACKSFEDGGVAVHSGQLHSTEVTADETVELRPFQQYRINKTHLHRIEPNTPIHETDPRLEKYSLDTADAPSASSTLLSHRGS